MKLYAPKYYKEFKCIADRCRHSCCIGWEIDVDNASQEKYNSILSEYGEVIRNSIDYTDTPHFRLAKCDRCPHLNDSGLCEIIINFGEEYLCDICREHPRFYNDTIHGKEVGLGMSCEEACRIILSSDDYGEIVQIDEIEDEAELYEFDTISQRAEVYHILSDTSLSYKNKLEHIYKKYNVSPSVLTDAQWRAVIASLEYLYEDHKKLFLNYSSDLAIPVELEKPLERALAYFIYRHCSSTVSESDFSDSLGFCLFCERLLASLAKNSSVNLEELARIVSEEIEYSEDNTETIKTVFFNWVR